MDNMSGWQIYISVLWRKYESIDFGSQWVPWGHYLFENKE
jgi:hypothetical protein